MTHPDPETTWSYAREADRVAAARAEPPPDGKWKLIALGSLTVNALVLCCGLGFSALAGWGIWQAGSVEQAGTVVVGDAGVSADAVEEATRTYLEQVPGAVVPDDLSCEAIADASEGETSLCTGEDVKVLVRLTDDKGAVDFYEQP